MWVLYDYILVKYKAYQSLLTQTWKIYPDIGTLRISQPAHTPQAALTSTFNTMMPTPSFPIPLTPYTPSIISVK